MPVGFLSQEQRQRYGRYVESPTPVQLAQYFHLNDNYRRIVQARRGDHNRLGFALQLGTVRFLGTFLIEPTEVPSGVMTYLAQQLEIANPNCVALYRQQRTWWNHITLISQQYGYQDFFQQPGHWRLLRWLHNRAWSSDEAPSVSFDRVSAYLVERKILLPGVTTLERLVSMVRERVQQRLWRRLAQLPTLEQQQRLEALLVRNPTTLQIPLEQLRRLPTRYSAPALVKALLRLVQVRELGVNALNFSRIPPSRIKALARSALTQRAQAISRMAESRRIATLVAFVHVLEATAQDDVLDMLELLVKELLSKSERDGKQARLRTLKDLDTAALQLSQACRVLLDPRCEPEQVRSAVFEQISEAKLATAIAQVETLARPADDAYYPEVLARWRQLRLFLPLLLRTINFQANKAGQPILTALQFLKGLEGHYKPRMNAAPLTIVSKGWQRWVWLEDGTLNRHAYTFAVLEQLMAGLSRRDIFISPSVRWSNPRAKLLQGEAWEALRPQVCRILDLEALPQKELEQMGQQLDAAYQCTAQNWVNNSAVRLEIENGRQTLILSHLDKLEESESLRALKRQVNALLPRVDLPSVLLEIQAKTGFMDEFTHTNEGTARIADFSTSLCAILIASACNIGIRPLTRSDVAALSRDRLDWVQQNYIRPETLTAANARLVAMQSLIPLAQTWGGGEVASADGLRFVVPVRTLNAGPNSKYFGRGRGITYYNFTSDQFTGLHGLVVPGTLRDSLVLLLGLLEQRTSLQPKEIMTDTAGYSDVVFGLFWLLGYQFSPRLADIGKARFWRLDAKADYGVLDKLSRQRVNSQLIEDNWDDMLRVAGSLKLGTVSALEIMQVLQRGNKPSTLAKAIGELGRVSKTLYLLNYVDDENYRRRILTQLNRGEGRHSMARVVFHGRKGEVRQPYREGQEDQLGTLGLVVNVLVLWNTLYMNSALTHLQKQGLEAKPEEIARLSPLGHAHINMLGRYHFELSEALLKGEMRPLRNLSEIDVFEEWED
jgi:TnpA family transposase